MAFLALLVLLLSLFGVAQAADASEKYFGFAEEVVAEDELHNSDFGEQIRREVEGGTNQATRSNRVVAENERIQKKREEDFANELEQLREDKAAAKKLLQRKKRDAKIVNHIYKSFQSNNFYAVLGIRNFMFSNLRIPNHMITIVPNRFALLIPGFELFNISEKKIKKAYREMAKLVHPDKSKDPRAAEAFMLVEDAAMILLNDATRAEYDMLVQKERKELRSRIVSQMRQGIEKSFKMTSAVIHLAKKILGSVTVPVVVFVALIA